MRLLRKTVILAHRYLGIGICLLAVMWFATGITMMYAGGMPRLTPELRLEQLPEIDPARVKLTPAEAADRAGVEEAARVTLVSVMDRPAYRIGGRAAQTVFADTGEILEDISLAQSRTVASRFVSLPEEQIHHVATLTKNDQWTLTQGRQMPLHKFRVDDSEAPSCMCLRRQPTSCRSPPDAAGCSRGSARSLIGCTSRRCDSTSRCGTASSSGRPRRSVSSPFSGSCWASRSSDGGSRSLSRPQFPIPASCGGTTSQGSSSESSRSRGRSADCCRWSHSPGQTPPDSRSDAMRSPVVRSSSRVSPRWNRQRGVESSGAAR